MMKRLGSAACAVTALRCAPSSDSPSKKLEREGLFEFMTARASGYRRCWSFGTRGHPNMGIGVLKATVSHHYRRPFDPRCAAHSGTGSATLPNQTRRGREGDREGSFLDLALSVDSHPSRICKRSSATSRALALERLRANSGSRHVVQFRLSLGARDRVSRPRLSRQQLGQRRHPGSRPATRKRSRTATRASPVPPKLAPRWSKNIALNASSTIQEPFIASYSSSGNCGGDAGILPQSYLISLFFNHLRSWNESCCSWKHRFEPTPRNLK